MNKEVAVPVPHVPLLWSLIHHMLLAQAETEPSSHPVFCSTPFDGSLLPAELCTDFTGVCSDFCRLSLWISSGDTPLPTTPRQLVLKLNAIITFSEFLSCFPPLPCLVSVPVRDRDRYFFVHSTSSEPPLGRSNPRCLLATRCLRSPSHPIGKICPAATALLALIRFCILMFLLIPKCVCAH